MVRNNTRMEKTGTKENIYIFQSDNLRPGCYWFGQLETILCLTQVRFALLGCSSQQALTHAAKEKEKNPHYTSTDRTQDNATPEIRSIFLTHLTSDKKRQSDTQALLHRPLHCGPAAYQTDMSTLTLSGCLKASPPVFLSHLIPHECILNSEHATEPCLWSQSFSFFPEEKPEHTLLFCKWPKLVW